MGDIRQAIWMGLRLIVAFALAGCSSKTGEVSNARLPTKVLTAENSASATPWLITRTPVPSVWLTSTHTPAPSPTKTTVPSATSPLYQTSEIRFTATPTPAVVDWTEAGKYVGEQQVVCGPVAGTHYAASSRGKPTFLNVGEDYPSPRRFVVLIWGEYRHNFPEPPESLYLNKDICVRGKITEYKGIFEIEIRSAEAITIR